MSNKEKLYHFFSSQLDAVILAMVIILSLFFHLYHFQNFNFAGDQGMASWRSLEIWRHKELTLVGIPITSYEYNGLHAHISSLAYYLQIVFLLFGQWQPPVASMIFAVIATFMTLPLYYGLKKIFPDQKTALALTMIYALCPLYIDYTRFLWNPNFQLLLLPVSIYFLGRAKANRWWLVPTGFVWGLMICLHYQLAIIIFFTHLFFLLKRTRSDWLKLFLGTICGLLPVVALEINTHFYNTKILWQILWHSSSTHHQLPVYYFMVSGFLLLVGAFYFFGVKIKKSILTFLFINLIAIDCYLYLPAPTQMWHTNAPSWFYFLEEKASDIIRQQNLANFAIVNLVYADPLANVQKYLLYKNDPELYEKLSADYYTNDYLFIIAPADFDLSTSINYEVQDIYTPAANKTAVRWSLSPDYDLILLARAKNITRAEEKE